MSDADLFIEKLRPKHSNSDLKQTPKSRIMREHYQMSNFINDFEKKTKLESRSKYISFEDDMRCRSTSLV